MRPLIQMIFTVQEVRRNDAGLTYVRGYVINGRDNNNNPNFATVNVFIPESASYYAEQALALEQGQRVFVAGVVSISSYMSAATQELRSVYKINYPSAFVPLDVPSAEPEANDDESEAVVEPVQSGVAPQQPQKRQVEMSGVARPGSRVESARAAQPAPAATATASGRPATFTIPRPQRVGEVTGRNNNNNDEADEIDYDPFKD